MRHPLYERCSHAPAALIFITALCSASACSAEIFKCATKDGTPLYQNFPCQFDSMGWLPSSPQTAPTTASATANASGPRIGMTADEIRALLGEPVDVTEDEPASGGRVSFWRYADGTTLQFDHKQRVLAVQRPKL